MHYQRFIEQLPNFYENWGEDSARTKSQRFQPILKKVKGMTASNVMQLLNLAIACLEPGEIYCQIGCFQGASLIGALLEHPDQMAYAVDNSSEFNRWGDSYAQLLENLSSFNLDEQVIFCNQDVEEFFFELRASQFIEKIGLYFYDGAQDYRSRLMGLLLVEPFLADQALIVLSHCHWESTYQASLDYIASHPQSRLLLDFSNPQGNNLTDWQSLQVISWDINANHAMNWSNFQESRKQTLISAIDELQVNSRQKAVDAWYQEAIELYTLGKYERAEQNYKQVLNSDSAHAEAWYNLGRLYYQTECYQDALEALIKALELDSSQASWHYNFGSVLEKLGAIPQAIRAYQEAIAIDPQWISAYNSLGNLWFEAGELEQAELMYRQVLAAYPEHYAGYLNLGNVLFARHQTDEAIESYKKALSLKPHDPDILNNLGLAFEAKNDQAQAYHYFGYACYRQGNYQAAIEYYRKFLVTQTGDVALYLALADCYYCLNQYEETIKTYREGISLCPQAESLYLNLALTLEDCGNTEAASAVLKKGSHVLLDNFTLKLHQQLMLPIIYESVQEIEDYRERFNQGLEELIQQTNLDTHEAKKNALVGLGSSVNFFLQYQGKNDLELQIKYGQFVHRVMAANYPQWTQPLLMSPVKENEKIRIGYISAYLRYHNGAKWAVGWIKNHNKRDFEIYCYHTGRNVDGITKEFQDYADAFHHIPDNLEAACQQIIDDKLHVLVFTDIGMNPQISQMAGLRLSPVQCTAWGHPITSGSPTIDYYLSSELMEPENAQEHYSEQLVRLPNIGLCYEKPDIPSVTKTRSDFQLHDEAVVYLSCQSIFKYLPQYDYIFPVIAQQVPQAKFAFLSHFNRSITEKFKHRLHQAFAHFKLNSEDYCVILPRQNWVGYASLNLVSDIYLDSLSWSGGNSTLEAIACNLPIVTCPGEFMRGRHSYGILKMLGVTETIAQTEAEYIDIAVRLGLEPAWRNSIVQRIRERHSYLYEDKTCVVALEDFYRRVVHQGQLSSTGRGVN